MRHLVLAAAAERGLPVLVEDVDPDRLATAAEVFLTNAVAGIRPVAEIIGVRRSTTDEVTRSLMACVA
jgi:branched-subunit amino acid aminotransferase/4-amino-4-deoxychorismate lyase